MSSADDDSTPKRIAHLKRLIQVHETAIQELEVQEAQFGMLCPPHIKTDLRDRRKMLKDLQGELQEITAPAAPKAADTAAVQYNILKLLFADEQSGNEIGLMDGVIAERLNLERPIIREHLRELERAQCVRIYSWPSTPTIVARLLDGGHVRLRDGPPS